MRPMNDAGAGVPPLPDLVLYGKPGCGLCREAREDIEALLRHRAASGLPVPHVVERDITTNEAWERAYFLAIPVLEFGGRTLELATSVAAIRALLSDVLDQPRTADAISARPSAPQGT